MRLRSGSDLHLSYSTVPLTLNEVVVVARSMQREHIRVEQHADTGSAKAVDAFLGKDCGLD
jgi:hypothetical protein